MRMKYTGRALAGASLVLAVSIVALASGASAEGFREMKFYLKELSPKSSFNTAVDPAGGGKVQMMVLDPDTREELDR